MSVAFPATPQECAAALAEASAAGEAVDVVGGGTRSRVGRPGPAAPRRLRDDRHAPAWSTTSRPT